MSLTHFLTLPDVRSYFTANIVLPPLRIDSRKEIIAPPLTKNYSLVGTAFDYLLRFMVKFHNPHAIDGQWVAESGSRLLKDRQLFDASVKWLQRAKEHYRQFIKDGALTRELAEDCLVLGQLDIPFRAGIVPPNRFEISQLDVQDILNLAKGVPTELLALGTPCILNPTFGKASDMLGGADCDLLSGDTLIDFKTTKALRIERSHFDQIVGYYLCSKIGGIDGVDSIPSRLGLYFSRYGWLWEFDIRDAIPKHREDGLVKWFQNRAREYSREIAYNFVSIKWPVSG